MILTSIEVKMTLTLMDVTTLTNKLWTTLKITDMFSQDKIQVANLIRITNHKKQLMWSSFYRLNKKSSFKSWLKESGLTTISKTCSLVLSIAYVVVSNQRTNIVEDVLSLIKLISN